MKNRLIILLVLVSLFVVDFAFGQGCSQCKLLAEQGGEVEEASFGSNINSGILFLMTVPYILIGGFILIFFRKKIAAFFRGTSVK